MSRAYLYIFILAFYRWVVPVVTYTQPLYSWPMVPGHSNLETMGNPSMSTGGCVHIDTGHPALDYRSVKLDGRGVSFKEFTLETMTTFNDFTISLFVSPVGESGTFFHYAKQDQLTGNGIIKNIIMSYNKNETNVFILGDNETDVLMNLTMQKYFPEGEWTALAVQYDQSASEFRTFLHYEEFKLKIEMKRLIGQPGKLRVGGSFFPGNNPYNGRATCLQFYENCLGNNFDDALSECLSVNWPMNLENYTDSSQANCGYTDGFYELISARKAPPSTRSPIANLCTSSRVRCADWCELPSNTCVAFAINRSQRSCMLFDVADDVDLVDVNGTDYYVSRIALNCC